MSRCLLGGQLLVPWAHPGYGRGELSSSGSPTHPGDSAATAFGSGRTELQLPAQHPNADREALCMTESFPARSDKSVRQETGLRLSRLSAGTNCLTRTGAVRQLTALRTLSSHRRGDLPQFHGDTPFLAISREI